MAFGRPLFCLHTLKHVVLSLRLGGLLPRGIFESMVDFCVVLGEGGSQGAAWAGTVVFLSRQRNLSLLLLLRADFVSALLNKPCSVYCTPV